MKIATLGIAFRDDDDDDGSLGYSVLKPAKG